MKGGYDVMAATGCGLAHFSLQTGYDGVRTEYTK